LRRRIARGEASPDEIVRFESESRERAKLNEARLLALSEQILAVRKEPVFLLGLWAQFMTLIDVARARGITDGEFHPQSIVKAGGGIKGITLPPDYKERVNRFFGGVYRPGNYGMTEMASMMARCEAGRYHSPPALISMVLDAPGERLLGPDDSAGSIIEGRFAFLDLLYEGRWGGVITGDRVQMDPAPLCPCGRSGPTLLDTIARYSAVAADDHIGCAGSIDAYVTGLLGSD